MKTGTAPTRIRSHRPPMEFDSFAVEAPTRVGALNADDFTAARIDLEGLTTALQKRGAYWDSAATTTDAGRMQTRVEARAGLAQVVAIEKRLYGANVPWPIYRDHAAVLGTLALLGDIFRSWVTFWDSYSERNSGNAVEVAPTAAPGDDETRLAAAPSPEDRTRELLNAPGAPAAGTSVAPCI
jgi:hypothetical protein